MQAIPKNEFADLAGMSMSKLLLSLRKYRDDLTLLGQGVNDNSLNYLSCLYICYRDVVDVREIYPTATKEEIADAYCIIAKKLNKWEIYSDHSSVVSPALGRN